MGEYFLSQTDRTYDVIYMDAFGELVTPPFHLLTLEMFQTVQQHISEKGILVMNIIASFEGPQSTLLSAIYTTSRAVFPHVFLYDVNPERGNTQTRNIILIASVRENMPSTDNAELLRYLSHQKLFVPSEKISMLSDGFAPVEHYAMELLK